MNITAPLRRQALLTPDAPAIVRPDNSVISYAALDRLIDNMARHTTKLGLRAGDIVALMMDHADEATWLILSLALARIGVVTATDKLGVEHRRLTFGMRPGMVRLGPSWLEPGEGDDGAPVEIHPDGSTLCTIFVSSGTTGTPKQIPVSHRLMANRVLLRWLGDGGGKVVRMVAIGLSSSWGLVLVLRTLWQGGTLVLMNKSDPVGTLRRHRVQTLAASVQWLKTILAGMPPDAQPLSSLESVEVGGSRLPAKLQAAAEARLCANLVIVLGSAEVGGISSAPLSAPALHPDSVGLIYPGVEVQAVDADHQKLPPGEPGLLRIRSDMVIDSYFQDPLATQANIRDGWVYSGDTGIVWPNGEISLGARRSDIINLGGAKVDPRKIEAVLQIIPSVSDAVAFGVPDEHGVEQVWAAIEVPALVSEDLLDKLFVDVPDWLVPQGVLQMTALPRNENGKIERGVLIAAVEAMQ